MDTVMSRIIQNTHLKIGWLINTGNTKKGAVAATAKSHQSCPTLWDSRDGSPPGSPVPGILQTRTLEWVAISFSNAWKWKVKVKSHSRVWLFATPQTAAHQAPPPMGFSRQECWNGFPLPSPKKKRGGAIRAISLRWQLLLSIIIMMVTNCWMLCSRNFICVFSYSHNCPLKLLF